MLCYVLVIGLVLLRFTVGEDVSKENKTKIACNMLEVKEAGDQFFDCFNKNVAHSTNNGNLACGSLPLNITNYVKVGRKSCYSETRSGPAGERDAIEFIKLVQFSMKNGAFQDFINNTGVECIAEVKNKISKCAEQEVGTVEDRNSSNMYRKYDNLWKMTSLTIDERSCKATNRIKLCTQRAMRSEGYHYCPYESTNVLYVGSLFDYMLERCSRLVPNWMESSQKNNPSNTIDKGTRITHILLGVLLTIAILAIFYVCFRDCRAPRGHWKAINERMSMSILNRRRTLVNNA